MAAKGVIVETLGAGELVVVCASCGVRVLRSAYPVSGADIEKARTGHVC